MDFQQNSPVRLLKRRGKDSAKGQYLQLVVSASYNLLQKPRQEIIDLCLKEVRQVLPAARDANLIKATVIKEAAATFPRNPELTAGVPNRKQVCKICSWQVIGPTPVGPPRWKAQCAAGTWRLKLCYEKEGRPHQFVRPDLGADGLVALWVRS